MKKTALLFCILFFAINSFAQSGSSAKIDKINKLLELSGSAQLGIQASKNLISVFKASYTNVDPSFWDEFQNQIKIEELIELIVPIYDKFYTEEDIDALIAFYNSPIGKKMVANQTSISQESMIAGQQWGKEVAERAIKTLKRKGYISE